MVVGSFAGEVGSSAGVWREFGGSSAGVRREFGGSLAGVWREFGGSLAGVWRERLGLVGRCRERTRLGLYLRQNTIVGHNKTSNLFKIKNVINNKLFMDL